MTWSFGIYLVLGLVGSSLGKVSRIPGCILIGAIVISAVGNFVDLPPTYLPSGYADMLQVIAGCLLGMQLTRENIRLIGKVLGPVLLNAAVFCATGILAAMLLVRMYNWSADSSWLASAPARMQEMVIYAQSIGADVDRVAMVHFARILFVLLATPLMLSWGARFRKRNRQTSPGPLISPVTVRPGPTKRLLLAGRTLALGIGGGILVNVLPMPGAILMGAFLGVGLGNLARWGTSYLPQGTGFVLQWLSGVMIGLLIDAQTLTFLRDIIPVLTLTLAVCLGTNLLMVWVLVRCFTWDLSTAWLASTPARMNEMLILGLDVGADPEKILAAHLIRVFMTTGITPFLLLYVF